MPHMLWLSFKKVDKWLFCNIEAVFHHVERVLPYLAYRFV